ncbi:MAG: hypothetical protein ACREM9_04140 [Gemmatimonadales bacterium]
MQKAMWVGGLLGVMALGCSEATAPGPQSRLQGAGDQPSGNLGAQQVVTGGGQFVHPDFGTVTFAFEAIRHGNGEVSGRFQQHQPAFGFTYAGDVTCFAVDPVNHRAWIAGVLTQSNDPDPVTEVGDDAWFRVLDTGQESTDPDRSTFFGFEQPPPGIVTSEEYCQLRIWPDDNARTWPAEQGNIVIH